MILNFKKFKFKKSIVDNDIVVVDMREELANLVYNNADGIAALETARKIYTSEDGVELSDNEVEILVRVVEALAKASFIDSLHAAITEAKQGDSK